MEALREREREEPVAARSSYDVGQLESIGGTGMRSSCRR